MINALDKKWKEFLYGFAGFGPNLLMVLMGAYWSDAINPAAISTSDSVAYMAIGGAEKICFILPFLFPILFAIAKTFDGFVDVPLAHVTDTLSTKWGRRRPGILVSMIPMIVSFAFCWWMPFSFVGGEAAQTINTIWAIFWAMVFFASYTMCLIAYYGSLSTTCINEAQRLRVSGYKSFFDTISYAFVYALIPVVLQGLHAAFDSIGFQFRIDHFVFCLMPLMLTMLIPLFMIKEGEKYGYPENNGPAAETVSFGESLKLTFKSKVFMTWIAINTVSFFGLNMFLVSMNALIMGGMGMGGLGMTILNTCAFAPVPVMLYLFNKIKAKKGVRFTYQTCLVSFSIAILTFFFGSNFILGSGNYAAKYIIGCLGGICGSWAIGAFFMMSYLVPTQVSGVEEKLTGKNHSAMYFAVQALFSSLVSAAGSWIYETIKMLWISKDAAGVQWAETDVEARVLFGLAADGQVFNLGVMMIPFIVCAACLAGFIIAFKFPKDLSPKYVAMAMKKTNPDLDISMVDEHEEGEDKSEIIFVQIGLSILSGFIFGFIWLAFLFKSVKELTKKYNNILAWALSAFVPFASIFFALKANKELLAVAKENGVKMSDKKVLYIILGIIFPIMPVNVVSLAVMQRDVNRLYGAGVVEPVIEEEEVAVEA